MYVYFITYLLQMKDSSAIENFSNILLSSNLHLSVVLIPPSHISIFPISKMSASAD